MFFSLFMLFFLLVLFMCVVYFISGMEVFCGVGSGLKLLLVESVSEYGLEKEFFVVFMYMVVSFFFSFGFMKWLVIFFILLKMVLSKKSGLYFGFFVYFLLTFVVVGCKSFEVPVFIDDEELEIFSSYKWAYNGVFGMKGEGLDEGCEEECEEECEEDMYKEFMFKSDELSMSEVYDCVMLPGIFVGCCLCELYKICMFLYELFN